MARAPRSRWQRWDGCRRARATLTATGPATSISTAVTACAFACGQAFEWFTTLFAGSLPSETVARVWDSLFVEGPKMLHRAALALLQEHETALLATDSSGELLLAARAAAATAHDRDGLMSTAFEGIGGLSMAAIDLYRHQQEQACQHEAATGCGSSIGAAASPRAPQQLVDDLGKQAGVLGRQAASNLRKGLGRLAAVVAEQRGSSSGKELGPP